MPRVAPVSPSDADPPVRSAEQDGTGFGRCRRIAAAAVFREALATRPRSRGSFFDILCLPVPADPLGAVCSRLGLVVPKRICRSAARRNRIKRMVRESFRLVVPRGQPIDCVVRLRRNLDAADTVAARLELAEHWRRVVS